MANEEIKLYIQKAREYGLKDDEIKKNLAASGWEQALINDAFSSPVPNAAPAVAPAQAVATTTPPAQLGSKWSWVKKPIVIVPVVIVILLAAGVAAASLSGFSLSTLGFVKPDAVWQNFSKKGAAKVYQIAYTLSYTDNGSVGPAEGLSTELKNLTVAVQGNGYLNITDESKPESQSDLQYTFKSGNTSFSTGVKYRITDNVLYFNVGENPFLNAIFNSSGDKKYDWVKLDLKAAKDQASSLSPELASDINNKEQFDAIKKIWSDAQLLTLKKYVGKEKVGSVKTLRFSGDINKQEIKNAMDKTIDVFADNATQKPTDKERQDVKDVTSALIDKLEIKEFDLWVGQKDFELYKMHFVSNAPAITDIIKASNEATSMAATSNATDTAEGKRIADIREVQTALELFYNDHNGYPEANRGVPQGLVPQYLAAMPISPAATGNCSDFYNTYWYVTDGNPVEGKNKEQLHSSYKLTFCLGHDIAGYAAGVGIATPSGVITTTTCPNPKNNCFIDTPRPDGPVVVDTAPTTATDASVDKIKAIIAKFNYNATITYDGTYSNYGKVVPIEAPSESLDLLEMFKNKIQEVPPAQDLIQSPAGG